MTKFNIYREYFQKSKVFLYPLLNIKKGIRFVPVETFISWTNHYDSKDMKLITLYDIDSSNKDFNKFEADVIYKNRYFENFYQLTDKKNIYIFDISIYKYDLNRFKNGEYSKFSKKTKEIIENFFGDIGTISKYVDSYLFPDEWHEVYAEYFNVPLQLIKDTHELCDKPNLKKENLTIKIPEIQLFKNNSLSLQSNK